MKALTIQQNMFYLRNERLGRDQNKLKKISEGHQNVDINIWWTAMPPKLKTADINCHATVNCQGNAE